MPRHGPQRGHAGALAARLALADAPGRAWPDAALATVAARIYHARRRRERQFDAAIFAEPAWDMLLDLFIARARGQAVPTVGLCAAAAVPASTALRWIRVLEQRGLVERHPAPGDRRTRVIALTEHGWRTMRQYLVEGLAAGELPDGGFG